MESGDDDDSGVSLLMRAPQLAVCNCSYSLSTSQKNRRDLRTQSFLLSSPTLNSWDILDLEMITSYPSLPVNVAVSSSLKQ